MSTSYVLLMLLLKSGVCQDQLIVPEPSGTNVHIVTCSFVEPRDLTPEELKNQLPAGHPREG